MHHYLLTAVSLAALAWGVAAVLIVTRGGTP